MAKTATDKIVDELHNMNKEIRQIENSILLNRSRKPLPDGIRPCYISKKSFKDGPRRAMFHRWIEVIGAAQTLALVEYEDGTVEQVKPTNVIFTDSKRLFDEFLWPEEDDDEKEENTVQIETCEEQEN